MKESANGGIAHKQDRAYPRTVLAALDGNSIVHAWTVAVKARASAFVLSNQRPGLEGGMSLSSMKEGDGELLLRLRASRSAAWDAATATAGLNAGPTPGGADLPRCSSLIALSGN